jgi:hypothetical protein
MHLTFTDQLSGDSVTLCIDRSTQTCNVLKGNSDMLEQALNTAAAMHVGVAHIIVDRPSVPELEACGWVEVPLVVMRRALR